MYLNCILQNELIGYQLIHQSHMIVSLISPCKYVLYLGPLHTGSGVPSPKSLEVNPCNLNR